MFIIRPGAALLKTGRRPIALYVTESCRGVTYRNKSRRARSLYANDIVVGVFVTRSYYNRVEHWTALFSYKTVFVDIKSMSLFHWYWWYYFIHRYLKYQLWVNVHWKAKFSLHHPILNILITMMSISEFVFKNYMQNNFSI